MGLDFVKNYQGKNLLASSAPSVTSTMEEGDDSDQPLIDLALECEVGSWQPIRTEPAMKYQDDLPRRFIDGSHTSQTITWVRDAAGHPLPVILAEIGAAVLAIENRKLKREFAKVDRIISLIADPFPWHEIEDFARDLRRRLGFRFIPAMQPDEGITFDFQLLRMQTYNSSLWQMKLLEQLALIQRLETPTLVDGPLASRLPGNIAAPVAGLVKQLQKRYVDDEGLHLLLDLKAGERSPAFKIEMKKLPIISWYLKLDDRKQHTPHWGVVRIEIAEAWFNTLADPFEYINSLSHFLLSLRCRQEDYARAAVSIEPIVHAERSMRSLFTPMTKLTSDFYHVTGI